VASAGGRGASDAVSRSLTDYEQLVFNLMFIDADSTSSYWNDACLLHVKEPSLSRPLTTLHSDEIQKKALDMFKVCISLVFKARNITVYDIQSFANTAVNYVVFYCYMLDNDCRFSQWKCIICDQRSSCAVVRLVVFHVVTFAVCDVLLAGTFIHVDSCRQ